MGVSDHEPGPDRASRHEPSFGRFDELKFQEPTRSRFAERIGAWDWRWIGLAVAITIGLLLLLRQPLADWLWPETRAGRLREDAARALAAGRLTATDGSGARELYEAALALDPDRIDARDGLNRVGQAALAQARTAISRRQYARAREALALAGDLSVPRAQVDSLREQLRRQEAGSVAIDQLLEQAAAARTAGRLDGEGTAALPLYQRVLELEPDRTEALEGREDTLSDLLQQARRQLAAGDLASASIGVRRVQVADAGHVELPEVLADLAQAAERRRRQADRELRQGNLTEALAGYGAALLVDAADAEALRGVNAVATAHAQRSERLAADYRFEEAEAELREAQAIAGETEAEVPAIAEARQHLARARQSQRQAAALGPSGQRQQRLRQLLADAAQAETRGDLLTPPGDSAFDKLRAARAIAPDDPRVKAATGRLALAATTCFDQSLRDNRLVRAGVCLDARGALAGDSAAVRQGRRELAQRWLAMGDQRLGAGEIQGAQAAFNAARALDPRAEGLAAFAERLRAASVAGDSGPPRP